MINFVNCTDISPTVSNVNDRPSKKSKVLNENNLIKPIKNVAKESKATYSKKKTTPKKEDESEGKKNSKDQKRSPVQSIVLTKSIVNGQADSDDSVYEKDTEEEEQEEEEIISKQKKKVKSVQTKSKRKINKCRNRKKKIRCQKRFNKKTQKKIKSDENLGKFG